MDTLDINECAQFLKIGRTYALELAGEGKLPGAKIGRDWVFLKEDLVEYLKAQVRLQMRQRAAEFEVEHGLNKAAQRARAISPLAHSRKARGGPSKIDLSKYESPELVGQVAAA